MTISRRPHQIPMADFMKKFWRDDKAGCILASEMGVGKTWPVLDLIDEEVGVGGRILLVVPAIARLEWVRQNRLYETGLDLTALDTGAKVRDWCRNNEQGVLVTSYHLLKHVEGSFHLVVCDECQRISNPEAGMTKELRRIVSESPNCFFMPLSGTPAEDRIDQLWVILDLVEPGQWGGSIWAFRKRYMNQVANPWAPGGFTYKGIRPDRTAELQKRLDRIMFRICKADVAESLPPLIMSMSYVKPKRSKLDWDDETSFDALLLLNSSAKLDATVETLCQARDGGETHFVAFTYLRQTAHDLGAKLRAAGFDVEVVTGDIGADARHAPIDRVRQATRPTVLVCNIDAVGVALDFTFATTAVFCEQSWVPGRTAQALGRLSRLSSTHSCNVVFVVVDGSKEMRQAEAFCRKSDALSRIIAAGRDERVAIDVLSVQAVSEEGLLAALGAA